MIKWWRKKSGKAKKVNLEMMKKLFDSCQSVPQLVCLQKPHKGCNDGFYEVRIPRTMAVKDICKNRMGIYVVLQFIGLKYD